MPWLVRILLSAVQVLRGCSKAGWFHSDTGKIPALRGAVIHPSALPGVQGIEMIRKRSLAVPVVVFLDRSLPLHD